eukprot:CAMPEP_0113540730 /NCGR_PEP_ID=MMETSP0015_2-20120614/8641_1 /TAXON_ID=2838 /ORGANISM="Odontella" /LENGTH=647 /DNA_ID=CAMNT_0000440563 /DNA_START=526 /DNA_END=2469 /DNA_ORIENTATION=- /assembly_acc=CAM_ASM_000160
MSVAPAPAGLPAVARSASIMPVQCSSLVTPTPSSASSLVEGGSDSDVGNTSAMTAAALHSASLLPGGVVPGAAAAVSMATAALSGVGGIGAGGTIPIAALGGGVDPASQAASAAAAMAAHSHAPHHPIPEFLYQLTKMLTDNNREIIEWRGARIHVHHPQRLADEVLHKYFRHSKYASFQRQLNYFGFRKIAGKGKMAPCSYVNDAATEDMRSLLFIKRKTNGSAARKQQQERAAAAVTGTLPPVAAAAAASSASSNALMAQGGILSGMKRKLDHQQPDLATLAAAGGLHPVLAAHQHAQLAAFHQAKRQQFAPMATAGSALGAPPSLNSLAGFGDTPALTASIGPYGALTSQAGLTQPFSESFHFPSEKTLAALAASRGNAAGLAGSVTLAQAGLSSLTNPATAALSRLGSSVAEGFGPASLAAAQASAAAESMPCPATAAMKAAGAAGAPLDSNISGLLDANPGPAPTSAVARQASQALLSSLPSSSALFPETLSTISLSQMAAGGAGGSAAEQLAAAEAAVARVGGHQRRSLLHLDALLRRDGSLADLAGVPGALPIGLPSVPSISQFQSAFSGAPGAASAAAAAAAGAATAGMAAGFEPTPVMDAAEAARARADEMGRSADLARARAEEMGRLAAAASAATRR